MPSITSASAPERTKRLRQHQGRGEADQPGAAVLDRAHGGPGRDAAGQHDVADPGAQADLHQVVELRVHGDQVDAERLVVSAWVAAISASSSAGPIEPQAITPKPPALEMAATRCAR